MNNIVKQMSLLYEQELYSSMVLLGELAISVYDHKQDPSMEFTKFQLHVYYAEALYNTQQYRNAESIYTLALQTRKYIIKSKSTTKFEGEKDLFSDVEIKYKIHLCCLKLKRPQMAIEVLQSISARARTPKVNMALGNLYRDSSMERSAISCYKEVLKESPLAMDAVENLLKLGVKGTEVNSFMLGAIAESGWISVWLRGLAEMYLREYKNAIVTFKSLDVPGLLKNNSALLINLARCYNLLCEDKDALTTLQRVTQTNPHFVTGRDLLSTLLANSSKKEHHKELDRLIPDFDMSLWSSEHWVVMGYHMFVNNKYERAAYFGQQACLLNTRNVEALLLKAATFMQINKYQEAALHYREALQYCPNRFESHYGLVQSYVAMNRLREATTFANNACKQMDHPAALTLYASVLLKDPMNISRARSILERVITSDLNYTRAVCMLAEQLEHEQSYDEAIALLKRHSEVNSSSKVHQMLADCYRRLQKDDEAFEHYNTALRLDPQNERALEGINNIGRSPPANKMDSNYYMSVEGESTPYTSQAQTGSDHEGDGDSDTDHWPNNGHDLMSFD
ncbi:hypothetical protein FQR65_LT06162 [Abscondita terminalis]|nr:hypothetical protein FQR65_LT06162 [Abscondita terminalis]